MLPIALIGDPKMLGTSRAEKRQQARSTGEVWGLWPDRATA